MDLIKNNIGLIAYSAVCLVLAVFISIGIHRGMVATRECETNVNRQVDFFNRIRKNDFALSKSNLQIAIENRKLMEKKFHDLRLWLWRTYAIETIRPPSAVECINMLQRELRQMHNDLIEKDIVVGPNCTYFSFDAIAKSPTLPSAARVPDILRQLQIIREVVRLLGLAEIRELRAVSRLKGLDTLEEDLYTVTPLRITVVGTPAQIQSVINVFHRDSRYLFFLRNVSLESDDQAPQGVVSGFNELFGRTAGATGMRGAPGMPGAPGAPGEGWDMMPPDVIDMPPDMVPPEMVPGARRTDIRGTPGTMRLPRRPGGGEGEGDQERLGPVTRKDLLVFQGQRVVLAELRFDLVEFREPREES